MLRIALCILGLLAIGGCGNKTADAPGTPTADAAAAAPVVEAATVTIGSIDEVLPVTGTITALLNREATVTPAVSGQIDSLPVRVGQQVVKGQLLAHISTVPLLGQIRQAQAAVLQNDIAIKQAEAGALQQQAQSRAGVLQAESAVSNARATLASDEATLTGDIAALHNAQQTADREQTLLTEGLVARKDVETAQLAVQTAEAQVDSQKQTIAAQRETVNGQIDSLAAAKSAYLQDAVKREDIGIARDQAASARGALETAKTQLALYSVNAPLDGRVVAVGANAGENVDTGTKLVTIADLKRMQLQLSIPSDDAVRVRPGQEVTFTVDDIPGREFHTVITTVGAQVDPTTNTVPAYAFVDNSSRLLQDDQTAAAHIVIARHDRACLVPRGSILTDPEQGYKTVAVIDAANVVHIRKVSIGIEKGNQVEVTGVDPGQKVAISGQYALPDGTKVSVQSAP